MVGKNHEHCNDAQQFYAGITPPFEIRVGGTALWEAVVFEPIIISPSFSLIFSNTPNYTRPKRPSYEAGLRPSTGPQAASTTDTNLDLTTAIYGKIRDENNQANTPHM